MKIKSAICLATLCLTAFSAMADSKITLTGVHNCCGGCTKGITKAIEKVDGASANVEDETVIITAKTEADAKNAVASLLEAGYYGQGAEAPAITDAKVKSIEVTGVHLCCGKCVKAVEKAVKEVSGASSHTAEKGADSFKVEGDFSTAELSAALNKAGLHGKLK